MTVDPTAEEPDEDAGLAGEDEEGDEPPDESLLMGVSGVQAQVEAEAARAEAELAGEAPPGDDDGAVV
ncbi:MAG TPA: hypothetical protein VH134_06030 [Candidatus Dormibacteraeota bacterium]|jgi:hypothetical protein|nr:hypothetical protein [Candidatus Dormibacteraeota bacterium]